MQGFLTHQVQSGFISQEGRNSRYCTPAHQVGVPFPNHSPMVTLYSSIVQSAYVITRNHASQSCLATTRIITRQPGWWWYISLPYIPPQLIGAMASTLPSRPSFWTIAFSSVQYVVRVGYNLIGLDTYHSIICVSCVSRVACLPSPE